MSILLEIESSFLDLMIGHGGRTIKKIQDYSKTTIQLHRGTSKDKRLIKIVGTDDGQRFAIRMIELVTGKIFWPEKRLPLAPNNMSTIAICSGSSTTEENSLDLEDWSEDSDVEIEAYTYLQRKQLTPIVKNLYVEHQEIKVMNSRHAESIRINKNIMVGYVAGSNKSRPIPKPILTFEHAFHSYPELLVTIRRQMHTHPSSIQCQIWPIIMSGFDLLAITECGIGTKLSYLLPALTHVIRQPTLRENRTGPAVLILGPTREFVLDVEEKIKLYNIFDGVKITSIHGGENMETQIRRLRNKKMDIIIATTRRLNVLIDQLVVKLESVSYVVLNEADCMLSMGLEFPIKLALRHTRHDKQIILTCYDWSFDVQQLFNYYANDPLGITVSPNDLVAVNTVVQDVLIFEDDRKEAWMDDFINNKMLRNDKVIIFMNRRVSVDSLYMKIKSRNINCRCIHGGMMEVDRERALAELFRGGAYIVTIIITTDAMLRGVDVGQDFNLVINYDFPITIQEYINRLSRIDRSGKNGSVITLLSNKDALGAYSLMTYLKKMKQRVPNDLFKMISNLEIAFEIASKNYAFV